MAERTYWAMLLTIIEAGIAGDTAKVRAYADLLAKNLYQDGDEALATRIGRVLAGQGKENTFGFEPWFGKEQESNR